MGLIFRIFSICFMTYFFTYCVIWNIVRSFYFIKCFKTKDCSNKKCKFNSVCIKYKEVLSKEEIESLLKLLD